MMFLKPPDFKQFRFLLILVNTELHTGRFWPIFCPCKGLFLTLTLQPNSNKC